MDLRAFLTPAVVGQGPENSLALSMVALSVSVECMNDAEWETIASFLQLRVQDRDKFGCMVDRLGGTVQLVTVMGNASYGSPPAAFIKAGELCGLEVIGSATGGSTEVQRGSSRAIADPGPGTEYLGPELWGLLQGHLDGYPVPPEIIITIGHGDIGVEPGLGDFIESLGGRNVAPDVWEVPSDSALLIVQRPDVFSVKMTRNGASVPESP